jgi:hypothetical protein
MTSRYEGRARVKCVNVPIGSALERALDEAEAAGMQIQLVRGDRRYLLQPLPSRSLTSEEKTRRRALTERALAIRDQQEPLGVTTAELVREARGDSGNA